MLPLPSVLTLPRMSEEPKPTTLAALLDRWGAATEEDALAYVEGATKADFIKEGRSVTAPRIDADAARLYGILTDFLAHATDAQRDAIPALTEHLVRAAIWTAHEANRKYREREVQREGVSHEPGVHLPPAASRFEQGKNRRRQLATSLRALSGQSPMLHHRIDAAFGSAHDAKQLSEAIRALVAIGRELLHDSSPAMVKRREGSRLGETWLAQAEALAEAILEGGDEAQAALASVAVSQSEVDYWDGLSLALLGLIIDICEAGHAADPSVPRLVPSALGGYFSPAGTKGKPPNEALPFDASVPVGKPA